MVFLKLALEIASYSSKQTDLLCKFNQHICVYGSGSITILVIATLFIM